MPARAARAHRRHRSVTKKLGILVGTPSAPAALAGGRRAGLVDGVSRLADRLELASLQPRALVLPAAGRVLRPVESRGAGMADMGRNASRATGRVAGKKRRRVHLHLRRGAGVLEATLAGCALMSYPHTTWLLDDGARPEIAELARQWGARYMTRPDKTTRRRATSTMRCRCTEGELVLVLDADHVPLPDALDTMVGYFEDPDVAWCKRHTTSQTTTRYSTTTSAATSSRCSSRPSASVRTATTPPSGAARAR